METMIKEKVTLYFFYSEKGKSLSRSLYKYGRIETHYGIIARLLVTI